MRGVCVEGFCCVDIGGGGVESGGGACIDIGGVRASVGMAVAVAAELSVVVAVAVVVTSAVALICAGGWRTLHRRVSWCDGMMVATVDDR